MNEDAPTDRAGPAPGSQQVALSKQSVAPATRADVVSIWSDGLTIFARLPSGNTHTIGLGMAPSYTAAQIAAVGNAVNTAGKFAGLIVFDTTNNRYMRSTGALAASTWKTLDGVTTVTPA